MVAEPNIYNKISGALLYVCCEQINRNGTAFFLFVALQKVNMHLKFDFLQA